MRGQFKKEILTLSDIGLHCRYNPYTEVFDNAIRYNKHTYAMLSNKNSNSRIYPKENSIVFHKNNEILGDNCFTRLHTNAAFTSCISSSVFNPIIDYIGNRRKCLNLVRRKIDILKERRY